MKSAAAFEGYLVVSMEGIGTSAITGRGVTLARLADTLSSQFKEFVIDETGMTGNYYFGLTQPQPLLVFATSAARSST